MVPRSVLEGHVTAGDSAASLWTHAAGEGPARANAANMLGLELRGTRLLGVSVDDGRERLVESPPMHVTWTPSLVRTNWRPVTAVRVLAIAVPDALLLLAASTIRGRDPTALLEGPLREPLAAVDLPDVAHHAARLAPLLRGDAAYQRLALEAGSHAIALAMARVRAGLRGGDEEKPVRALTLAQQRRALEYIDAHLGADLSLPQIAAASFVSPFHFARAFRATFGRSPWQYVLALRLERARNAVERSSRPLSAIAVDHGFAHPSHFTTAFHRAYGEPPLRWRERRTA